jgi:hypothetical protein
MASALPLLAQHVARTRLGAFCSQRIPAAERSRVRLDLAFADNHVTVVESRPKADEPGAWNQLPVARFRYNAAAGTWALLCPAFGQKDAWRPYPVQPTRELDRLIATLDEDATGIFWG